MILRYFFLGLWFGWVFIVPVYAQRYGEVPPRGDAAAAEQYALWARQAMEDGRWGEAREALERAADFSDGFSDLSYLLAQARFHEGAPRGAVLEALRRGRETDRWYACSPDAARLLEAEVLIGLRSFSAALRLLTELPPGPAEISLRLAALKGLGDREAFRRTLASALDLYPRDPRPVRILFEYFGSGPPQVSLIPEQYPGENEPNEWSLIRTALRRLPLLVEADRDLAYLAVPFIADPEEARRSVAAYRAGGESGAAAIPAALELGLIDEERAMEELFSPGPLGSVRPETLRLDRALLLSVWALLRTAESRERFSRNLSAFSGVIMDDGDQDGYPESWASFEGGLLASYQYDGDQDGLADLEIFCNQGAPEQGLLAVSPGPGEGGGELPAVPVKDEDRLKAVIRWEQYPAVEAVFLEGINYVPRPFEFLYTPLRFVDLAGSSLHYPERDPLTARITRRTLAFFSLYAERPGRNFDAARERVSLDRGIPQGAVEFLDGRVVSETEFVRGRPVVQRVDLDLDGRLETVRRFRGDLSPFPGDGALPDYLGGLESSQSDWDGDGVFEAGEEYFPDGTLKNAWNVHRDGVK
jgi:hypothetical protein